MDEYYFQKSLGRSITKIFKNRHYKTSFNERVDEKMLDLLKSRSSYLIFILFLILQRSQKNIKILQSPYTFGLIE